MSLCIPIPTMNCAITATVHFGWGVAINWIYERSAAEGRSRSIAGAVIRCRRKCDSTLLQRLAPARRKSPARVTRRTAA